MSVTTYIAIYFIMWWVVLFAVLPWGVRSQEESGDVSEGSDPGAPAAPRIARKLIWTTIVTGLVFAVFVAAVHFRLLDADDLFRLVNPLNT
jgi:predicted secreted protein